MLHCATSFQQSQPNFFAQRIFDSDNVVSEVHQNKLTEKTTYIPYGHTFVEVFPSLSTNFFSAAENLHWMVIEIMPNHSTLPNYCTDQDIGWIMDAWLSAITYFEYGSYQQMRLRSHDQPWRPWNRNWYGFQFSICKFQPAQMISNPFGRNILLDIFS